MQTGTGRRDLKKEAAWRRRVDRHADSGQSVRAWCHKHGLKESAFYWWRGELARRDAERKPSVRRDAEKHSPSFVSVHVTEDGPANRDSQIEIVLTDGRCVRVIGSLDRQMLAGVLDVLERGAC
jgi:hypothetical protein